MQVYKDIIKCDNKELKVIYELKPNNKRTYFLPKSGSLLVRIGRYHKIDFIKDYIKENFNNFYQKTKNQISLKLEKDTLIILGKRYNIEYVNNCERYLILGSNIYINQDFEKTWEKIQNEILKEKLEKEIEIFNLENKQNILLNSFPILKIRIRKIKSAYGYYRKKAKDITLSLYSVMLPKEILWHIIFHEYAHFKYFDHSKNFYEILKRLDNNFNENIKNIKKYAIF